MAVLSTEQEGLCREQTIGVFATIRRDGSAQLTPVNYVYQDGLFLISTTRDRAKYPNVSRNPNVTLCISGPEWRPYVTVYGRARIEEDDIVEGTGAIYRHMTKRSDVPENFEETLKQQKRVLIVLTPERALP
jgi:PPOX class probable F420-dependent enzyme